MSVELTSILTKPYKLTKMFVCISKDINLSTIMPVLQVPTGYVK